MNKEEKAETKVILNQLSEEKRGIPGIQLTKTLVSQAGINDIDKIRFILSNKDLFFEAFGLSAGPSG